MKSKKGLITVIEISMMVLLFTNFIYLIYSNYNLEFTNYYPVESLLESFSRSESFTLLFLQEDLSTSTISGNWTSFETIMNSSMPIFAFSISNNSHSKQIYTCDSKYSRIISEKFIENYNNTLNEFRVLTLEVCI